MILPQGMVDQFSERGYAGPLRVLSALQCQRFIGANHTEKTTPLDWDKGLATSSRAFYEIATQPAIIEVVTALLGEDVMLWGASMQGRSPGAVHPWHSDIESSEPSGRTVAVWLGLQNTSRESSLLIVPYSQRFGLTVQEMRRRVGKGRHETTDEDILGWARERDKRSQVLSLKMSDGEALFFDGRLWHGSQNLSGKLRRALLLQYATPDIAIRIPDLNYLDWPFQQLNLPRPACLMVSGSDKAGVNRVVPGPVAAIPDSGPQLTSSRIYPLRIPLPEDEASGWKPYPIFSGSTADLQSLSCHVSVLTQNHCPHPPHRHQEEELLLLLMGEVDLILPDAAPANGDQRRRLKPGQFVYYPAHFAHTLETVSNDPANYLMFKWHGSSTGADSRLGFGQFDVLDPAERPKPRDGFCPHLVFEGPTAYLRKLHCHVSTLTPQAGYDPHVDSYDVSIIVLEGEVETLGERVGPHGVIFYPGGETHGMRNPGAAVARYIVFEFHGSRTGLGDALPDAADALPDPDRSFLDRLTDPESWKRSLKRVVGRFSFGPSSLGRFRERT
jgi:mannose-6-phosphate isomerase-like protein (cupin superfamily)